MRNIITVEQLAMQAGSLGAQELLIRNGMHPAIRKDGEIQELMNEQPMSAEDISAITDQLTDQREKEQLARARQVVFGKTIGSEQRFRVSIFYQRGTPLIMLRRIPAAIPPISDLGLPEIARDIIHERSGLLIIAGPVDSGRTTTAVSMLNAINQHDGRSIVTVESPIEYLLQPAKSVIAQRSIPEDVRDIASALAFARDEHTDVIFVDNVNSKEAAAGALDLASGGRLVLVTFEAQTTPRAIAGFVGLFPQAEERHVRQAVSDVLLGIVNQRLVPTRGGGRTLAAEILRATDPVRAIIREGREQNIGHILETSRAVGMQTLDQSLYQLVERGVIERSIAQTFALQPDLFAERA